MKKQAILDIIDSYNVNENVLDIERRVDLLVLSKSLKRLSICTSVLTGVIILLTSVFFYINYRDKKIMETMVLLKNGEIQEEVELLRKERESFTITKQELNKIKKERYYNTFTASICDYLADSGIVVKFSNVKAILIAIDETVPKWFPNGEFTPDDFYSLSKLESNFIVTAIGKHGERGVLQILEWRKALNAIGKSRASAFDINVNVEMGCYVLKEKLQKHKNYKTALIAYNGYVLDADGKLKEDYWQKFKNTKYQIKILKDKAKKI